MQLAQVDYREQIASIVVRQLTGDFSDTLTRFSYLQDGAENFLQLIHNPDYLGYNRELVLIDRMAPPIIQRIGDSVQIVDLGPGDGCKASRIMACMDRRIENYLALDMSRRMLDIARRTQSKIQTAAEYHLCDFSNMEELRTVLGEGGNSRLFLLLGNTLTNEISMEHFLRNSCSAISASNRGTNYLLLGVELLDHNPDYILREYRNEENYALTRRPLETLGTVRNNGVVDILFNEELRRVEEWFVFTESGTIATNLHCINFEEGDRILLSVTYKPTLDEMTAIVRNAGWDIEFVEHEENQAMILLSKI